MSQATADIVVNSNDSVQFTFTAEAGGLTKLVGASVTLVATTAFQTLTVTGNTTTVKVPSEDSILQLALLLGPDTENCDLTYSVNNGASVDFFDNRPLFNPIIEVDLFGK